LPEGVSFNWSGDLVRRGGLFIAAAFDLGRREVSDRTQQPMAIVPVHPLQGFPFDGGQGFSRPELLDDLGLEWPDDVLGQRVSGAFE